MRVAQHPKIEIDPRYVANREEDGFVCSTYTRDDQQYSLALLGARMAKKKKQEESEEGDEDEMSLEELPEMKGGEQLRPLRLERSSATRFAAATCCVHRSLCHGPVAPPAPSPARRSPPPPPRRISSAKYEIFTAAPTLLPCGNPLKKFSVKGDYVGPQSIAFSTRTKDATVRYWKTIKQVGATKWEKNLGVRTRHAPCGAQAKHLATSLLHYFATRRTPVYR